MIFKMNKENIMINEQNEAYAQTIAERKARGDNTKPYGGRLEQWSSFNNNGIEYFSGNLHADPSGRWSPGQYIRTSGVLGYTNGDKVIETRNTHYDLGDPLDA